MEERTLALEVDKTRICKVEGSVGKTGVRVMADLYYGNITKPMLEEFPELKLETYMSKLIDFLQNTDEGKKYIIPNKEQIQLDLHKAAQIKLARLKELEQKRIEEAELAKQQNELKAKQLEEQKKLEEEKRLAEEQEAKEREGILEKRRITQEKYIKSNKTLKVLLLAILVVNLLVLGLKLYELFIA